MSRVYSLPSSYMCWRWALNNTGHKADKMMDGQFIPVKYIHLSSRSLLLNSALLFTEHLVQQHCSPIFTSSAQTNNNLNLISVINTSLQMKPEVRAACLETIVPPDSVNFLLL